MAARGRVDVDEPGKRRWGFTFEWLRLDEKKRVRTVFEMRELGAPESVYSELVARPGESLVNWYWNVRTRRFARISGILATDRFAETIFRYEDLWLADPGGRRSGEVAWVEDDGRRWIEISSEPYHYYQRVVTRVDPETALPVGIRFYDVTGAPIREMRYAKVEEVDGRPFPKRIEIQDLSTGAASVLEWEEVYFRKRIPLSFFELDEIDNRIRKGVDPVPVPPPA